MKKQERYKAVIDYFLEHVPVAETELYYENPFQLLVAVILSAQSTDKGVNKATPELFKVADTPEKIQSIADAGAVMTNKFISYHEPSNKSLSVHLELVEIQRE